MGDHEGGEVDTQGPADELAELAHGLARLARRRRAMGARRTANPPALVPGTAQDASHIEHSAPPAPTRHPAPTVTPRPAPLPVSAPPPVSVTPPVSAPPPVSVTHPAPPIRPAALAPAAPSPASPPRALAPGATPDDVLRAAASCADLTALAGAVADCRACALGATRKRSVFADGAAARRVLFVGEAPGYHEDQTGVPFVGEAGQLLSDIIVKGMGLDRARDVYICNVLKCRPPDNRDPMPEEKALCTGWLDRQIELVDPLVIIALGRHAATHLLGVESALGRLRGRVHQRGGRPVVVTYHPAYLLRNPADKRATWQDIQLALSVLGLPVPGRPSAAASPDRSGPDRGGPDPGASGS